jgi:hypothetical protein
MTDEELLAIWRRVRRIDLLMNPDATFRDTSFIVADLAAEPINRVCDVCAEED